MRVLLTGADGFIGHHVAAYLLAATDWDLVCLGRCANVGTPHRLMDTPEWRAHGGRVHWLSHDLRWSLLPERSRIGPVDYILHLAASSHVDRSIADPLAFVMDNVVGTCNLLDFCRAVGPQRVLYFSTDEVFGPAPAGVAYKEWDRYRSGNPYAATKAGAEELCLAYHNTYSLPVLVTHTMNVFGERQHPEKFIPKVIRAALAGDLVTIHADATRTKAGSRFYIHARDVARAVLLLLAEGEPGEKYNIVGAEEVDNLRLAEAAAATCGKGLHYELVDFHSARPGHDLRYALDGSRLAAMGFAPERDFYAALAATVRWYLDNPAWLR